MLNKVNTLSKLILSYTRNEYQEIKSQVAIPLAVAWLTESFEWSGIKIHQHYELFLYVKVKFGARKIRNFFIWHYLDPLIVNAADAQNTNVKETFEAAFWCACLKMQICTHYGYVLVALNQRYIVQ